MGRAQTPKKHARPGGAMVALKNVDQTCNFLLRSFLVLFLI